MTQSTRDRLEGALGRIAAPDGEGARLFTRYLDTPEARGLFAARGIE